MFLVTMRLLPHMETETLFNFHFTFGIDKSVLAWLQCVRIDQFMGIMAMMLIFLIKKITQMATYIIYLTLCEKEVSHFIL